MSTGGRFARNAKNTSASTQPQPPKNVPKLAINEALFLDVGVLGSDRSRKTPRKDNPPEPAKTPEQPMGLISNAFMGATTKFMKAGGGGGSEIADTKNLLPGDKVGSKSELKPSPGGKFGRSPQVATPQKGEEHEGGRKIERRHGGQRELKFTEKKEEESEPSVVVNTPKASQSQAVTRKPYARNSASKPTPEPQPQPEKQTVYNPYQRSSVNKPKQEQSPVKQPNKQETASKPTPYKRQSVKPKEESPAVETPTPVEPAQQPKPTPKPYRRGQKQEEPAQQPPPEPVQTKPKPAAYRGVRQTTPAAEEKPVVEAAKPQPPQKPSPYRPLRKAEPETAKKDESPQKQQQRPKPSYPNRRNTEKPESKQPSEARPQSQSKPVTPYRSARGSSTVQQSKPAEAAPKNASSYKPYQRSQPQPDSSAASSTIKESTTTPSRGVRRPARQEEDKQEQSQLKIQSQASSIKPKPSPYGRVQDKSQEKSQEQSKPLVDSTESKPKPTPYKTYRRSVPGEGSPQQTMSEITPAQESKVEAKPTTASKSFIQRQTVSGQQEDSSKSSPVTDKRAGLKQQTKSEIYPAPSKAGEKGTELVLKKSAVAGLILKRLVRQQISGAFDSLRGNLASMRAHSSQEAHILLMATVRIHRLKEVSLVGGAFETVKKVYKEDYISQAKAVIGKEYTAQRTAPCGIIEKVFVRQLRQGFEHLHRLKEDLKQRTTALRRLEGSVLTLERRQTAHAFSRIKSAGDAKGKLLGRVWSTVGAFYGHQLRLSLLKLALHHPQSAVPAKTGNRKVPPARPPPSFKQQLPPKAQDGRLPALEKSIRAAEGDISGLEGRLQRARQERTRAEKELKGRIGKLSESNREASQEMDLKRSKHEKFKQEIEVMRMKKSVCPEGEPDSSGTLDALTHLYINNFREGSDEVPPSAVSSIQREAEGREEGAVLREWGLIRANLELKGEIGRYEEGGTVLQRARASLQEEQRVLRRLISSYVREQYFWQWIHLYANE